MPDLESPSPVIERLAPIPSYLPAWQVHLLSGPPGGGKTTLLASWAKAFRDGLPIFGKHTNQLPWVGTILADREKTDTLQWYAAVGLADIPVYSIVDDPHLNEDHLEQRKRTPGMLEAIIDNFQIPDNGLLIIDPIVLWCGGDLNKYHIVYPAMIRLARLCLRRHITILGLCHTGKQKGDSKEQYTRAQDRILGSTALLGCSGTQMALEPPPKDSDDPYRFTWVPHHAKEETFELTRGTDGLFVLPEYSDRDGGHIPYPEVLTCIPATPEGLSLKLLVRVLAAKQIFLSRSTLMRILAQYHALKLIEHPARGTYRRPTVM